MWIGRRLAYQHIGTFKGILFLTAVVFIVSVLVYTQVLISRLKDSTRNTLQQKIRLYSLLVNSESPDLIALALEQIQAVDFPIIVTDGSGNPKQWKNVPVAPGDTSAKAQTTLRLLLKAMREGGNAPLPIAIGERQTDWFHYGDSIVIRQLRWLPWIEIVVAALFVIIGYTGFRNIKRSEERMVWVGLAKETAHQLGTPLTSLMGWIELLKSGGGKEHALEEMERDLQRLERVTARFSQIGSEPVVGPTHILPVLHETVDYFRRRLPKSGKPIEIKVDFPGDPIICINVQLFGWVMENLIKNSIDALRSSGGEIRITHEEKALWLYVDIADNGPGIASKNRRNVFRPGFSTKTRGWGLGLSLSKRIIEDYHGGRLFIKDTAPGRGTVMRIALRKARDGQ
ncbi:sensor histidine kinase [candidate division KSB1 bacterium]|nr:MAG: sensor histidine kinase [candidate division KSB1 bacterium]